MLNNVSERVVLYNKYGITSFTTTYLNLRHIYSMT